jgi:hypothetical protein
MIAARQIAFGSGKRLPYDAEVEYLESTGTQWIDTEVQPVSHSCVIRFQLTSYDGNQGYVAGSYNANNRRFYPCLFNGNVFYVLSPNNVALYTKPFDFQEHVVEYNMGSQGICRWDGTTIGSINATFSGEMRDLFVFANHSIAGADEYLCAKVFSVEIRERMTDVIVRDLIPVRFTNENNQTEGAMYDKVTKQIFRNPGTGAFVIGPDKR